MTSSFVLLSFVLTRKVVDAPFQIWVSVVFPGVVADEVRSKHWLPAFASDIANGQQQASRDSIRRRYT